MDCRFFINKKRILTQKAIFFKTRPNARKKFKSMRRMDEKTRCKIQSNHYIIIDKSWYWYFKYNSRCFLDWFYLLFFHTWQQMTHLNYLHVFVNKFTWLVLLSTELSGYFNWQMAKEFYTMVDFDLILNLKIFWLS